MRSPVARIDRCADHQRLSYTTASSALSKGYALDASFLGASWRSPEKDVIVATEDVIEIEVEPPLEFLIGRDAAGNWLAIETHGLAGGFFRSATEAFRFVASDCHASRAKRIELVREIIDPFDQTCVQIARHHENVAA